MSLLDLPAFEKIRRPKKSEALTYHYDNRAKSEELRSHDVPNLMLSQSLCVLDACYDQASPERKQLLANIVVSDARDLAAHILPADVASACDISFKYEDGDNYFRQPILSDVFLLARAHDYTHEATIQASLEYILTNTPTSQCLDNLMSIAYSYSVTNKTPVMDEYKRLASEIDSNIEAQLNAQMRAYYGDL